MSHRVHVLRSAGLIVVAAIAPLAAQDSPTGAAPGGFCLRARPKPACDAFALTSVGGYAVFGATPGRHKGSLRGVLDYGLMFNVNARSAFGVSVFASMDDGGIALGPSVRYRRWFTPAASLDVALGTPVMAGDGMRTGAVFGLVKWNPTHWLSLAARPEVVRQLVCDPVTCALKSRGRVSLGTEVGAAPGLVLTGVGAAGFGAFIAILLLAGFGND